MKDINGIEIKIGDTVKTQQPGGGFLPPANPTVGEVVNYTTHRSYTETSQELAIKFKKNNNEFYSFILLHGKINEVINQ